MMHTTNIGSGAFLGKIPVSNQYTAGPAGEAFLRALKDRGEILGSPCAACKITYVPARLFCERCFAELRDRTAVQPTGTLETFTVAHLGLDGEPLDQPAIAALVKLDGATTPMMHFFLGSREQARIGAKVKAVFKPAAQRKGSILDIRGFEPS